MASTSQSWECPQCLAQYPLSNSLPFLRGTCKHDVCKDCIMKGAAAETSRRCTYDTDTNATAPSAAVLVQCPIGRCVGGFLYEGGQHGEIEMNAIREGDAKVSANYEKERTELGSEHKRSEKQQQKLGACVVTPDSATSSIFDSYDADTSDEECESKESKNHDPCANERERSKRKRRLSTNNGGTSESGVPPAEFMNSPIFHVNPFISVKKKTNKGFAPFIHEGVVTAGMDELPASIACRIDEMSYEQIKTALKNEDWFTPSDRWQVAMWLKHATIGSYLVMRHEYGQCSFCPQRLKDNNGKYVGKVYVIGVITKRVSSGSLEEKAITEVLIKWGCPQRYLYNFCLVEWKRMGMKADLSGETQRYLNSVCVPTIARICNKTGDKQRLIRQDLWERATMTICPNEFDVSDVHYDS